MSELQTRFIDDTYAEYYNTGKHELAQVYLKSEADKVIAEKDKEIQRLENLCESYRIDCDNLAIREANAYKEIERDNKQLRHHKYKRCLTMARWCASRSASWCFDPADEQLHKSEFYDKWKHRWLELAEKLQGGEVIEAIFQQAKFDETNDIKRGRHKVLSDVRSETSN